MDTQSIYDIPVNLMDGSSSNLQPYKGKVLLITNVASRCGFTPQYAKLESLYQDYQKKGVSILAFPCDQFLHQEPGTNEEIKQFAESCYRVTFPMFAKTEVKGKEQSPLYAYLKSHMQKKPLKFIPWNFTKVLVDQNGNVLRQFAPTTSFEKIKTSLDELVGGNNTSS